MSSTRMGHSAQDAETRIVPGPEDAAQLRFLTAAVEHAAQQLTALEDQAERIAMRFAQLQVEGRAKVANAEIMRNVAGGELAAWQSKLAEFERRAL